MNIPSNNLTLVSIIIPCRNEGKFIGKCLDSIIAQDYPKDNLEVLIVDGMSDEETREIVKRYIEQFPFVKLLDNPKEITPVALNIGIKHAKGKIITIMGAHATYGKGYISKCIKYLNGYNADNVGGKIIAVCRSNTILGKAITFVLSHPFGVGNSYFRASSKEPKWVDTVFGGCYKKEVFEKIGLFNENLIRTQDMEFNLRLKKAGGKILLAPDIVAYYYPKSNLKDFFIHNFEDGIWAIYPLKFVKIPLRLRHYIPFLFVLGLFGAGILGIFSPIFFWLFLFIVGSYFLVNIYFSIDIAIKRKDLRYLFLMPITFASRHLAYGFGSIWGLIKILK